MRKKFALFLAAAMVLSLTACGKSNDNSNTTQATTEATTEAATEATTQADNNKAEGTMGQILLQDFKDRIAADENITPQEMAEALLTNPVIQFMGAAMPMEPGYLAGFSEEISGFSECVMFAPMIGSIPFVGYIFTVDEGNDVNEFAENLEKLADPRWNICVEADETIIEISGNTVFFLMCPNNTEG